MKEKKTNSNISLRVIFSISLLLCIFPLIFFLFIQRIINIPVSVSFLLLSILVFICSDKENLFPKKSWNYSKFLVFSFSIFFGAIYIVTCILNSEIVPYRISVNGFFLTYFFLIVLIYTYLFLKDGFSFRVFLIGFIILSIINIIIASLTIILGHLILNLSQEGVVILSLSKADTSFWGHTYVLGLTPSRIYFIPSIILLGLFFLSYSRSICKKTYKTMLVLMSMFLCVIVFMTEYRTGIIMCILSILAYAVYYKLKRFFRYLPLVFFLIGLLFTISLFYCRRELTIKNSNYFNIRSLVSDRVFQWQEVVSLLNKNKYSWLIGYGIQEGYGMRTPNSLFSKLETVPEMKGICIDNQYLSVLFNGGIIGFMFYFGFWIFFWIYILKKLNELIIDESCDVSIKHFLIAIVCMISSFPSAFIAENSGSACFLYLLIGILISKSVSLDNRFMDTSS